MTVAERETTAIGTASTAGARRIGEAFAERAPRDALR